MPGANTDSKAVTRLFSIEHVLGPHLFLPGKHRSMKHLPRRKVFRKILTADLPTAVQGEQSVATPCCEELGGEDREVEGRAVKGLRNTSSLIKCRLLLSDLSRFAVTSEANTDWSGEEGRKNLCAHAHASD